MSYWKFTDLYLNSLIVFFSLPLGLPQSSLNSTRYTTNCFAIESRNQNLTRKPCTFNFNAWKGLHYVKETKQPYKVINAMRGYLGRCFTFTTNWTCKIVRNPYNRALINKILFKTKKICNFFWKSALRAI